MKKQILILATIASIAVLISCRKKENEGNKLPYLGGRVVLINSDTPVPDAVVRFAKWANTCLTCPMSYIEVGTDTTDESGRFEIPTGTGATMAIAFGLDSIFNHESQAGDLDAYWLHGGEMKLQLTPPAWVKVSAFDVEPLNPDINYAEGFPSTGTFFPTPVSINQPLIWLVDGNISQWISYRYKYMDGTFGSFIHLDILPPTPFDTTEYVISY